MQLHASYVDGTDELSAAELRFLRLEGLMLPMKSFKPTESTHGVPGLAADVAQSWLLEPSDHRRVLAAELRSSSMWDLRH